MGSNSMKALSLWQPWASAIFLGLKAIETRSWETNYRGPLLIHAAKCWKGQQRQFADIEYSLGRLPDRVPLGALLGVAELVDCVPVDEIEFLLDPIERMYGNYSWGRFGLKLASIRAFTEPLGYRGAQGFFNVPDAVVAAAIAAAVPVSRKAG